MATRNAILSSSVEKEKVMKTRSLNGQGETAKGRHSEVKRILEDRRREILTEVQEKMRDVRADASGEGQGVLDAAETSEADIQDDIEFALIQMKTETLHKIEEALIRLEEN